MTLLPSAMRIQDPFPTVLKLVPRPRALSQGDAAAINKWAANRRFETGDHSPPGMVERALTPPKPAFPPNLWRVGVNPPKIGDYPASVVGREGVFRHWNGFGWSLPWGLGIKKSRAEQACKPAGKDESRIQWKMPA